MEKRKYTRVHVITTVIVESESGAKKYDGVITNLSVGGVGIISPTPLDVGTDVKVSFKLSNKLEIKDLRGFVTRSEQLGDKYFTFVGVNFLNVDSEKRVLINKYVLDRKLEQYSFKIGG